MLLVILLLMAPVLQYQKRCSSAVGHLERPGSLESSLIIRRERKPLTPFAYLASGSISVLARDEHCGATAR